MYTIQI